MLRSDESQGQSVEDVASSEQFSVLFLPKETTVWGLEVPHNDRALVQAPIASEVKK